MKYVCKSCKVGCKYDDGCKYLHLERISKCPYGDHKIANWQLEQEGREEEITSEVREELAELAKSMANSSDNSLDLYNDLNYIANKTSELLRKLPLK